MSCREWDATGSCKFGNQCRYAHNERPAGDKSTAQNQPPRGGEGICNSFLTKGSCKYGDSCRYKHERLQTDYSYHQPSPKKQNIQATRNNSYQQPRGGEVVPQFQQQVNSQIQGCITDISPRMFPPSICEDYYYSSNCRYGNRCNAYHISEKQLLELDNNNKMSDRNNTMKNERNRENNNYNKHSTNVGGGIMSKKTLSNNNNNSIKPEEIIKLYKEKSIAEINSFTVDYLSNFTVEIEDKIAEAFSISLSKIDDSNNSNNNNRYHNRNNNNNSNNKLKMTLLLSYFNVLKLLVGKYGIEFVNKLKFKTIRFFFILCLGYEIEVSYVVILYTQLLDGIKENPMRIDSEKSEEENRKSVNDYIEKFGNRLCSEFRLYDDAIRFADHFHLDTLKQKVSLCQLLSYQHTQIYQIYKEMKKFNFDKKLGDFLISELLRMNDSSGYVRFFSHVLDIEKTKDFRKSNYINQYLRLSDDIDVKFISTVDEINSEVTIFSSFKSPMIVGFDMEWKPVRKANVKEIPSILQLAINKHIVIIDLLKINENNLSINIIIFFIIVEPITSLLNVIYEKHVVAGSGLRDDITKLKLLIPSINDKQFKSIDFNLPSFLNTLKKSNIKVSGSSLQNLSISLLGCNVDKNETMSNWEDRPLSEKQIQYAAIDAHISLHICNNIFKASEIVKNELKLPENIKVFVNQENDEIIEHQCLISGNEEYSYNEEVIVDSSNIPPIPEELLKCYGDRIPKECFKYVVVDEKLYNENGIKYLAQLLSKYFIVSKECIGKIEIWNDNGTILCCIGKIDDRIESMAISYDYTKPAEKINNDELIKNNILPYNLPLLKYNDKNTQILISDSLTFNRNIVVSTGFNGWYMNIDIDYLMDFNTDICILDGRYFDKKRY